MITEHPADIVLLDYVEGVLRGDASESVRRHIAACRACRRTLTEISNAVSELEGLPTADPGGAAARRRRLDAHRWFRFGLRLVPVVLAALALGLAILFVRPGSGGGGPSSAPPRPPRIMLQWQGRVLLHGGRAGPVRALRRLLAQFQAQIVRRDGGGGVYVIVPQSEYLQVRAALGGHIDRDLNDERGLNVTLFGERERSIDSEAAEAVLGPTEA